jgi:hypothetical protein
LLKSTRVIFGSSVLMSFVASGPVTGLYLVPALEAMATKDALTAIAVIHTYRFIGACFPRSGGRVGELAARVRPTGGLR